MEEPNMGFYYAAERKRFEKEWDKLRKEYEAAGMSLVSIQLLYEFDLEFFRSQRTYINHTQTMPDEYINEEQTDNSALFRKFETSVSVFNESDIPGRYAWLDTIENQQLALALRQLTGEDLELLTLFAMDGFTQSEIATMLKCNQSVISRKLKRIKNFLR